MVLQSTSIAVAKDIVQTTEKLDQASPEITPKKPLTIAQTFDYEQEDVLIREQGQVTSVTQLSDVQPTDWAFQALQSLVERYGCIAGYPDSSYRGNRAMTRYEFAAGLNACLDRITEIIASSGDLATREDLATIQRLQEEFSAEMAALRGRVDVLEARTTALEANQFSTTSVMGGEIIFGLAAAEGGDPPGNGDDQQAILAYLARLGIVSSFSGKDRLAIGMVSGNFANRGFAGTADNPGLVTDMALYSFQTDTDNRFQLDLLEYRTPVFNDRVVLTFAPQGFSLSSVLTANSPFFDSGRGAVSRFGQANPLFKIGSLDAGVGFDWLALDRVRLQFAYGTRNSSCPGSGQGCDVRDQGGGITGSDHSALGVQLLMKPRSNILTGLAYINAYSVDGRLDTLTGSFNADASGFINEPTQTNAVSATFQWRVNRTISFAAWGGYAFTDSKVSDAYANTYTYTVALGFSDLFGREGDLLGLIFGQPLKLADGSGLPSGEDEDTSLHFEAFYRFKVSDNIAITPGLFVITNPEHNSDNDTIFLGVLRSTFRF
ncbi:iron uptake porin [Okeania sp.]|uniref:iron uptake porin n=1 Tax=Okeania sp. TaxID=3100323 RepID=UPI002B4ABCA0|nr:iron uptake porin [Okeania sp.]